MDSADIEGQDPQLLKGVLPLLLLRLLSLGESYGYELVVRLRASGLPGLAPGTVYPALARLERRGEVTSYLVPSASGPARKYYRLTGQGRATMADVESGWRGLASVVESVLAAPNPPTPEPQEEGAS